MNTNSRRGIRSTIKWGGAVVTLLLLIVWVWSARWELVFEIGIGICIGDGVVQILLPTNSKNVWWSGYMPTSEGNFVWWFGVGTLRFFTVRWFSIVVPIWFLAILAGTLTRFIWRWDRKLRLMERAHTCPKCGYSRTGLPADRACPECGAACQQTSKVEDGF